MTTREVPIAAAPAVTRPVRPANSSRVLSLVLIVLLLLAIVAFVWDWASRSTGVSFPTPYQAVLLTNNAVYYGQLEGYGTQHPVLKNVFYVLTRTDNNTHQVSNMLVKRGKELHAPDRMYLSPNQIVFVETVGKDSKVAQLIAQAGKE